MRATTVLQKVLGSALGQLHVFQQRSLLGAVEALIGGRRLTLMDLARSFPGAQRVGAPLKRLDRLLGNCRVAGHRERLYAAMGYWWLGALRQPLLVVDWSELDGRGRWCLLRAALVLRGRSLVLLDWVVSRQQLGHGGVQRRFVQRLHALLPAGICPILISDAGFRGDWFRALQRLGWQWIGRVRGGALVREAGEPLWQPCRQLQARRAASPRQLGVFELFRTAPVHCCLVLAGERRRTGRAALTRAGEPSADRRHLKAAAAARERWLLACSMELGRWPPARIIAAYRRRMQIEESFRDLKSHHYGHGFEDTQTRTAARLQMLLLIHALAVMAALLIGHVGAALGLSARCLPHRQAQGRYSLLRLGWELAARGWISLTALRAAPLRPPQHPDDSLVHLPC